MKVHLKEAIIAFPQLFDAKAFDADSDEKFSGDFLIERGSENEKLMKAAIKTEAVKLWPDKADVKLKAMAAAGKIWCLRDGDARVNKEGEPYNGYPGRLYVNAKNTIRPLVIDGNRAPLTAADGKPYSGAVVNAIIDVRVGNKPSDQAYAYLLGVQFVRDGERLAGGSVAAADDFEAIPDTAAPAVAASGAAALF